MSCNVKFGDGVESKSAVLVVLKVRAALFGHNRRMVACRWLSNFNFYAQHREHAVPVGHK